MKPHILIVDDEPSIRFVMGLALGAAGFKISQAEDGREALRVILANQDSHKPFNLLLVDIRMPNMSGIQLMKKSWILRSK